MEEWKKIPGINEAYEVSNTGKVRSLDRYITRKDGVKYFSKGKELKLLKSKNGYVYVNICCNHISKHYYVHRLVASAFIENPDNFDQVNHKNEIKNDNNVDNLEWCTGKYNVNYGTCIDRLKKARFKGTIFPRTVILVAPEAFCIFKSVNEASRFTGYASTTITEYCQSKKVHNGILFQYMDDFDFFEKQYNFGVEVDAGS